MPQQLTDRQTEVLETITALAKQSGRWPTVREIGAALGIGSPNGIWCHIAALRKKGAIAQQDHRHSGVRVLGKCPCCGR